MGDRWVDAFLSLSPGGLVLFAWLVTAGYYFGMAGGLYWLLYVWRPASWRARKIQERDPPAAVVRADLRAGAVATVVMALVLAFAFWLMQSGHSAVSRHRPATPGALAASVAASVLFHDAYFYAVHRWLHTPWLFRRVHAVHHRNRQPTPWSTFAFHPAEALLNTLFIPLVAMVVPAHPLAFAIFLGVQGLFNAIGHTGFEFFPRAWRASRWAPWTSASHHDEHHRVVSANYGLYLAWWDKIFGTGRASP